MQLLEYLYAGKVDCIYIDPPYNTGDKSWKYNNNYVDNTDAYRHSKWLSFMEKRLKLAKKLLNPNKSVLIVTIDEHEYLHLGCLLEQIFPESIIQMVTSVINPKGTPKQDYFARVEEYIFYIWMGDAKPSKTKRQMLLYENSNSDNKEKQVRWAQLQRSGGQSLREDTDVKFYPIFIDKDNGNIIRVGDHVDKDFDINSVKPAAGEYVKWPIKPSGIEGCWQVSDVTLRAYIRQGRVKVNKNNKTGSFTLNYLMGSDWKRVENGEIPVLGKDKHGALILGEDIKPKHAKTVWNCHSHSATEFGTSLLRQILIGRKFAYPKSLYAVHDCIKFAVKDKPDALIVDFFAGSGTTLHAVNLLNAEDGGHRRCIMVTNNEVSNDEAKSLAKQGFHPGDDEWEKYGIARYVTWPRTVCSIEGHDVNGKPLMGNYFGPDGQKDSGQPMSAGFRANCIYFKLGFLDKNNVALGRQFCELIPILWMKAGSIGPCPIVDRKTIPSMLIKPENHFAVLVRTSHFADFKDELEKHPEIETVYIVTDSSEEYRTMTCLLNVKHIYQLYKNYLENFQINGRISES